MSLATVRPLRVSPSRSRQGWATVSRSRGAARPARSRTLNTVPSFQPNASPVSVSLALPTRAL
ncbi:hypothetical protein Mterra_03386 [Calidithermus terrae]|uniref:Uncharacterized protein n=1 Tax=Calidithermus terrae TaxID=1408545 RepID=A0A399EC80_9DEIN|nr:hypothetical protein Mterra_03386 [Calidithermus terrae]